MYNFNNTIIYKRFVSAVVKHRYRVDATIRCGMGRSSQYHRLGMLVGGREMPAILLG